MFSKNFFLILLTWNIASMQSNPQNFLLSKLNPWREYLNYAIGDETLPFTLAYPMTCFRNVKLEEDEIKDDVVLRLSKEDHQRVIALDFYSNGDYQLSKIPEDINPLWEELKQNCLFIHRLEHQYEGYEMRLIVPTAKNLHWVICLDPVQDKKKPRFYFISMQKTVPVNSKWPLNIAKKLIWTF